MDNIGVISSKVGMASTQIALPCPRTLVHDHTPETVVGVVHDFNVDIVDMQVETGLHLQQPACWCTSGVKLTERGLLQEGFGYTPPATKAVPS